MNLLRQTVICTSHNGNSDQLYIEYKRTTNNDNTITWNVTWVSNGRTFNATRTVDVTNEETKKEIARKKSIAKIAKKKVCNANNNANANNNDDVATNDMNALEAEQCFTDAVKAVMAHNWKLLVPKPTLSKKQNIFQILFIVLLFLSLWVIYYKN